jgi:hypothetical protein
VMESIECRCDNAERGRCSRTAEGDKQDAISEIGNHVHALSKIECDFCKSV